MESGGVALGGVSVLSQSEFTLLKLTGQKKVVFSALDGDRCVLLKMLPLVSQLKM